MSVPQAPKTGSLTNCLRIIRCLSRLRRLLRLKAASKKDRKPPETVAEPVDTDMVICEAAKNEEGLDQDFDGDQNWMIMLRKSVTMLHFGSWEEREAAAKEMKKLAREDVRRRRAMAELGVIPPLVAMVGSEMVARRRLAVGALIELANGCFTNKALMVDAGILSRLPKDLRLLDEPEKREFAELLLSISSLANTQFSLNSQTVIPRVICILESGSSIETKELCLSTLHNLSSLLNNVPDLITAGVVNTLIKLSSLKQTSEKSLATLANLVVTSSGRKAVEQDPTIPEGLIEIMTWEDSPKCQESSAYILMILAHQSSLQRQKMSKAGIVQVLLEVALLGSPLAQKRAMKLLQWFKDERQTRMGAHSGPQVGRTPVGLDVSDKGSDHGKMMMRKIVKQSLYKNMETITRRANGAGDSSKMKVFLISSSSKSLPY